MLECLYRILILKNEKVFFRYNLPDAQAWQVHKENQCTPRLPSPKPGLMYFNRDRVIATHPATESRPTLQHTFQICDCSQSIQIPLS